MKLRRIFVGLTLSVILLFVLSACAPANTVTATFFQRKETYTTVTNVPELLALLDKGDLTGDQAVAFATKWSSIKYNRTDKETPGYQKLDRLTISYGKLGILHVGGKSIVLPGARTYLDLPVNDDEVTIVDALCVDPGKLATRFSIEGVREYKAAQKECYSEPLADWVIAPYLTVQPGQVAYRLKNDGSYEFKGPNPGAYPEELLSLWNLVSAVQVGTGQFGIYVKSDKAGLYIGSGINYDVVPSLVRIFPTGSLRYRTLTINNDPNGQGLHKEDLASDSAACASFLCETVIDKMVISGTQRQAMANVEALFIFPDPGGNGNTTLLDKYAKMGSIADTVQTYVGGKIREAFRNLPRDLSQTDLETEEGKAVLSDRATAYAQAAIDKDGIPIVILSIGIRSIDFNDKDIRDDATAAERALLQQQARIKTAEAEAEAIEAETAAVNALRIKIAAKMGTVSQVINTQDGISCPELALLSAMGVIDPIDWNKLPSTMCQNTNTTISVTAP